MSKPFKLKVKDSNGHRVWATRTPYGHRTACRFANCNEPPREVLSSEVRSQRPLA